MKPTTPSLSCLITGISGFIGTSLAHHLLSHGIHVRGTTRQVFPSPYPLIQIEPLGPRTSWETALQGHTHVIHLAGTVHDVRQTDPAVYSHSILEGTQQLARQAADMGVRRFVYVSSANVYGTAFDESPLSETHPCHPLTPYAQAKHQAEDFLLGMSTPMERVIIRPPLVYGPGVKGNFKTLIHLIRILPVLPLGCAHPRRSFIGIRNFISFLTHCLTHPNAKNTIFNVSDGNDLSPKTLASLVAQTLGKKRLWLPVPPTLLKIGLQLIGKKDTYEKVFTPLRLEIEKAKTQLTWEPPYTVLSEIKNLSADLLYRNSPR